MSIEAIVEEMQTVYERYGEETLIRLLELAPLVAGSGSAWQFAVEAMTQGEDGTLIVNIPGLAGEPPYVTWMGSGWHVVAEPDAGTSADQNFSGRDRSRS